MKRNELIKLRELMAKEIARRDRLKELLNTDLIKEYIELTNTKAKKLDSDQELLKSILSSFLVTETNEIYVCTRAYLVDWDVCYEDTNYYSRNLAINSPKAETKIYVDIESGKSFTKSKETTNGNPEKLISTFEQNNIVLNPYNTCDNKNGYHEVRLEFFESALKDGQAKAKKLILKKYPQMIN